MRKDFKMTELELKGAAAKKASRILSVAGTENKNNALLKMAELLVQNKDKWLEANKKDIEAAKIAGITDAFLDRLTLTEKRIEEIAKGVKSVAALQDPVGEIISSYTRDDGLKIDQVRVPVGVIGIIFEARPNVAVDAAVLCVKAGNACILRGGKEAINSNICAVNIMRQALELSGLPADCITLVEDTSRQSSNELMSLTQYVDVLIPRGGRGLIRAISENAKVPVIRTGEGVCHIYVDKDADIEMGARILYNAKCSRPSVCNAVECLILHKEIAKDFLEEAEKLLEADNVELRCDDYSAQFVKKFVPASEEDWDTEYDDYILAVKTVESVDEAIEFITKHGTEHSEAIITTNESAAEKFLNEVDAAAVYVNASTRFTDGGEFGMGAEIGISTQKLHARGPMGLKEITSTKYKIYGKGQVR